MTATTACAYEDTVPDVGEESPPTENAVWLALVTGGFRFGCEGDPINQIVVVLAGLGRTAEEWTKVQPAVSAFARVCSYDRAGSGGSDEIAPQNVAGIVEIFIGCSLPPGRTVRTSWWAILLLASTAGVLRRPILPTWQASFSCILRTRSKCLDCTRSTLLARSQAGR
jgi:hypothetical protein